MSLKLQRVELVNIRSHEQVTFEPEAEGITALQGVNGSGKSTIVDSIAWTLFGTKPNGVSKISEVFRSGIGEKDKAFARIDMLVDGKPVRFERRRVNKHGAVECEVWSVEQDENGDEVLTQLAGPAISHAEPYIRKMLHMDEQGFLASILVQQKQVDQLISASPRERGAVIEKLTGIAGITSALVDARHEFNSLRKAASFSSIDEQALENLRKEEKSVTAEAKAIKEKLAVTKAEAAEVKTKGEAIKTELHEATEKFEKKASIEKKIADLETRKDIKNEQLEETSEAKEVEKRGLSGANAGALDELEEKIADKSGIRDSHKISKARNEDKLSQHNNEKVLLENELESLDSIQDESIEALQAKAIESKFLVDSLQTDIIEYKNESAQIKSAIEVIKHGESCPTCLQKVDDASIAVKALQSTIDDLTKKSNTAVAEKENAQIEFETIEKKVSSLLRSKEIQERIKELNSEISKLKKAIDKEGSELLVLESELKTLNKQFDEARKFKERQKSYRRLLEKAQSLTEEIESIEYELVKLRKEGSTLESSSQRAINSLQKKLDDTRAKHSTLSLDFTNNSGELKVRKQKIEFLHSEIKRHEEDIRKHKELLDSVSIASHTVDIVSEFRENRIRNSIPVIETYASELLSRFTEGKFTRLTLDQKFNATAHLADGTPRAVGLLSGGELSAAAMSLRLAIAMLLNSGADQNTVILDEVLVSQDAARAEQILVTIKEMFQGQVILIAHNESIDSVADKIVRLSSE